MKYDFSTFLKQTLNEADKQSVYSKGKFNTTDTDEIENWLSKRKDSLKVKDNKLIYTNDEGKDINLTDNNKDIDLVKIYKEIRSTSTDKGVVKSYNKDTFEKLGETYAYRSIVCLASLNNVNDFKEITNDVFENDPDNVLMQINDLPAYFDFAGACTAVTHKLNKEEKDSESAKIATQCKTLLSDPKTRFEGIEKTKKEIKEDFTKYHDIFTKAFDDGLKEQHKKMSEKDFKWVDPVTGLPPKGFKGNAAKILGKGIESITAIGNKFADKIKSSPHNLENDIARAAIIGVKLIAAGVHGIGKLFSIFGNKKFTYKNITSKSVDKKINEFKPKYEEAKKGNYLPSQIKKESTEEDKKKCEQFKRDFQSLMYDELIPMYYKQIQVFSECYLNLNNKYILLQTKDGWQTKQTENGKYTELWNAVLLLKEHIEKCDKFFKSLKLYDEFKDSKMELFLGSVEKKGLNEHQEKIKQWFDKIDEENTDKEKIDALKNIINIYTEDIMLPSMSLNSETFAQYKDKLSKSLTGLKVIKEIPLVNGLEIKFKDDDNTSEVKGIKSIEQAEKENKEELSNEYKEIRAALDELKNVNELEKVNDTFTTINSKVNNTIDQLKGMVEKETDEEKKKKLEELLLSKTTIDKVIAIKAIMKNFKLIESVAMNEIIKLLNEAEEGTPDIEGIKKEISEIIEGDITLDNVNDYTKKSKDVYDKINGLYNKLNDDTKKNLEEYKDKPLQLLYAIGAIKGEKKEEQAPVDANQTQEVINNTKQAIETAEDTDIIFTDEYYDKLKGELKEVYSKIDEMTKNNDELLQAFIEIKIDDDIKNELLPNLWHYKRFLTIISQKKEGKKELKDSYNPFYAHDMLVLLEAETEENKDNNNVVEALKAKTKTIKEILAKQDVAEFNKEYKVWKDEINQLLEKFDKIENKDKLTDPLQKLSAMGNYIKNKPEEKKEETQPAEGGAKSEESAETKKS